MWLLKIKNWFIDKYILHLLSKSSYYEIIVIKCIFTCEWRIGAKILQRTLFREVGKHETCLKPQKELA